MGNPGSHHRRLPKCSRQQALMHSRDNRTPTAVNVDWFQEAAGGVVVPPPRILVNDWWTLFFRPFRTARDGIAPESGPGRKSLTGESSGVSTTLSCYHRLCEKVHIWWRETFARISDSQRSSDPSEIMRVLPPERRFCASHPWQP
jgi:hypothetical protein